MGGQLRLWYPILPVIFASMCVVEVRIAQGFRMSQVAIKTQELPSVQEVKNNPLLCLSVWVLMNIQTLVMHANGKPIEE